MCSKQLWGRNGNARCYSSMELSGAEDAGASADADAEAPIKTMQYVLCNANM